MKMTNNYENDDENHWPDSDGMFFFFKSFFPLFLGGGIVVLVPAVLCWKSNSKIIDDYNRAMIYLNNAHLPWIHAPTMFTSWSYLFLKKTKQSGLCFSKTIVVAIELLATTTGNDFHCSCSSSRHSRFLVSSIV